MLDALLLERLRQLLGGLYRGRAHEHWRTAVNTGLHIFTDGFELLLPSQVDQIVEIIAQHGHIGRNHDAVQAVDLTKFKRLRVGGSRHPRELVVKTEKVLERGRGERLTLTLNLDSLLGLNRLM